MSPELSPRYEIHKLGPEHAQWASAIVCHSNVFHSSIFSVVYPEEKTQRFNAMMQTAGYLVDHQISSGLSYGVFDTEYRYKEAKSAATGGQFYWDPEKNDATGNELLEAMDFPLVSVALAYDGFDALDMSRLVPVITALPVYATINAALDKLDPRPAESWKHPKEHNQLLMRNATSTRRDYGGKGLMSALAKHLQRAAAAKGFKTANIECLNDRVTHVWANPPSPFRGEIVASFQSDEWEEEDADGRPIKPFGQAKQLVTRVCTTLCES